MPGKWIVLGLCLTVSVAYSQQNGSIDLGRLQTGAKVSFVRTPGGEWGIEIKGSKVPVVMQPRPFSIQVFLTEDDIHEFAAGYKTVKKSNSKIDAFAEIAYGDYVIFRVNDIWSLKDEVISLKRKVEVSGNAK